MMCKIGLPVIEYPSREGSLVATELQRSLSQSKANINGEGNRGTSAKALFEDLVMISRSRVLVGFQAVSKEVQLNLPLSASGSAPRQPNIGQSISGPAATVMLVQDAQCFLFFTKSGVIEIRGCRRSTQVTCSHSPLRKIEGRSRGRIVGTPRGSEASFDKLSIFISTLANVRQKYFAVLILRSWHCFTPPQFTFTRRTNVKMSRTTFSMSTYVNPSRAHLYGGGPALFPKRLPRFFCFPVAPPCSLVA